MVGDRNTFAEAMTLMDTPDYIATAQAVAPTQLFRISNRAYLQLLQNQPTLMLALMAKLCVRLHQRIHEIETLSLKNATHRVVRYLLTQASRLPAERQRFSIPVSKQLIAGHLSIQPETLSRILHRLHDERIICLNGREIDILDRPRLENFE
ncbi:Crp-like helix-turn-helix domain protein [compost metagenome]